MYPVNDYIIVEEVKTEDSSPSGTGSTLVLYKPPTDGVVRKYRIVRTNPAWKMQEGEIVWAQVKDALPLDNLTAVRFRDVIATDKDWRS